MNKPECSYCDGKGTYSSCGVADNMDVYEEMCEECNGTGFVEVCDE